MPADNDITIVGGGCSGLLLAMRLTRTLPTARLAVLEKEAHLGGRLCGNIPHLQLVSRALVDFLCVQTCASGAQAGLQELPALHQHTQLALLVAATKMVVTDRHALFSTDIVRQLSGSVLASGWEKLCVAMQTEGSKKTLKHYDPPLATLLDKLAVMLALPSLSSLSVAQLRQKLAVQRACELFTADWQQVMQRLIADKSIVVRTECQVVDARRKDGIWELHSAQGTQRSRTLVVAHPPWQASGWLAASYWPAALAKAVRKNRPHSVVCLVTTPTEAIETMPAELCVAAEGTHVLCTARGELALARVLSYETQLRAPAVTAAVGKLKRALRTLNRIYTADAGPRLIALVPAAHCLPLGEGQDAATGLFFCGDSCGKSENGDDNVITSVQNVHDGVVSFLRKNGDGADN